MTLSAFDPKCLSSYPAAKPPQFLHFQWDGSEAIHRYMLVDKFHVNDINHATKREPNEGSDEQIRARYVMPVGEPEVAENVAPEPATLPGPDEDQPEVQLPGETEAKDEQKEGTED